MIHLINFLVKAIMTVIFAATCGVGLIALAIVFWDKKYLEVASTIQGKYIWGAKEK